MHSAIPSAKSLSLQNGSISDNIKHMIDAGSAISVIMTENLQLQIFIIVTVKITQQNIICSLLETQ